MWRVAQVLGVLLIVAGLIPPVNAFVQFVKAGGTPMPIVPTQCLVVTGFNRYVRNPMYVGLLVVILGQALLFGSWSCMPRLCAALLRHLSIGMRNQPSSASTAANTRNTGATYRRGFPAGVRGSRPVTSTRPDVSYQ